MEINRQLFDQQRRPRSGDDNPERMQFSFWEWMIRGEYGPHHARDLFKVPMSREDGPIWTFDRMGMTRTDLPDGRTICIGGEHEDSYDTDFCIYNDVVVLGSSNQVEIYGYPTGIFPPTDFHTATLVDDRIFIIGGLGYPSTRRHGLTPVFALDVLQYRISEIQTSGEMPGWIFRHEAYFARDGAIIISDGEIVEEHSGAQRYRRNMEEYALDIKSGGWRCLSKRNWRQFSILQENRGPFVLERRPELKSLLPRNIEHTVIPCDAWNGARMVITGVPVSLTVGTMRIEVIIEGELPDHLSLRIAEEVRANAEAAIQGRCIIEQ